jgi:50S ribosomal subunit-associated GTPase HflX
VLDASNPDWPRQRVAVDTQLHDLELDAKPRIIVFNKIDAADGAHHDGSISVSAFTGAGLDALRTAIAQCA